MPPGSSWSPLAKTTPCMCTTAERESTLHHAFRNRQQHAHNPCTKISQAIPSEEVRLPNRSLLSPSLQCVAHKPQSGLYVEAPPSCLRRFLNLCGCVPRHGQISRRDEIQLHPILLWTHPKVRFDIFLGVAGKLLSHTESETPSRKLQGHLRIHGAQRRHVPHSFRRLQRQALGLALQTPAGRAQNAQLECGQLRQHRRRVCRHAQLQVHRRALRHAQL